MSVIVIYSVSFRKAFPQSVHASVHGLSSIRPKVDYQKHDVSWKFTLPGVAKKRTNFCQVQRMCFHSACIKLQKSSGKRKLVLLNDTEEEKLERLSTVSPKRKRFN